jgi:hypothetical protein
MARLARTRRFSVRRVLLLLLDSFFVASLFVLSSGILVALSGHNPLDLDAYDPQTNTLLRWSFVVAKLGPASVLALLPVVLVFSPVYLCLIAIAKWGWFRRQFGHRTEPAASFIGSVSADTTLCLILRPFGNDAYFSFANVSSTLFFGSLILNWKRGLILEQLIERLAREEYGLQTVALVDPSLKHIPSSPKFVAADHSIWKIQVNQLIQRARFVFVILPPGLGLRDSLLWEIKQLVRLGMRGRFALVIPPQNLKKNARTIREIKAKLAFLADNIRDLDEATFLIHPRDNGQADSTFNRYRRLPRWKKIWHRKLLGLRDYEGFLRATFLKMGAQKAADSPRSGEGKRLLN